MPNYNKIKRFQNGSPTLTSGLVAYWPLDEASGTRAAFWGEDDLTDNATVTRAAGKFGYAGQFTAANSEYLNSSGNVRLNSGNFDFTIACWVYLTSTPGNMYIAAKWDTNHTALSYALFYNNGNQRFEFRTFNDAAPTESNVTANSLGAPSTATWYFIVAWHDAANDQVGIQINDLQQETASANTSGPRTGSGSFYVGANNTTVDFLNGRVQHLALWKRVLTAEERRDLYLGSAAEAFSPDTDSTLTTRLISFWKLDEAAGTRRDSYGGNNLTDNATVTSAAGKVGNAGQFTAATSEYLSIADNASLSASGGNFSVAAWVYLDSKPGNDMVIANKDGAGTQREWGLRWQNATDKFTFDTLAGATTALTADTPTPVNTATWYFVVAWYDGTNANIQVNNGTVYSAAATAPTDTTAAFEIGRHARDTSKFWNGRIDEVGFWKKVLTAQERTDLYNSTSGNTYPQAGNGQAMEEIDFATDFPDLLPHGRGIQTFERIAETSLSADAANIDFTSISGKYRHLMISASLRNTVAASTRDFFYVRFNGDTGANYDSAVYTVNDSAALGGTSDDGPGKTAIVAGTEPSTDAPANSFGAATMWIPDYVNRARHKSLICSSGIAAGTTAGTIYTSEGSGRWRDISSINRVTLLPVNNNWLSGSRATLYGIRTHKFLVDQNDTLVENLVGYWKLDETSGTRVDSWGANHLTDNATVTSNPGRYGIAGQFASAIPEYLSVADNAALSTGDIDFTIAAWVYMDTKSAYMNIASRYGASGSREWKIRYDLADDRFKMSISDTDNTFSTGVSSFGSPAPSTARWYLVIGWFDSVNNETGIQVNNEAVHKNPTTLAPGDKNVAFEIGRDAEGNHPWNGRIDEVGLWKKVLSAQERSDLYNNGYGNTLVKLNST